MPTDRTTLAADLQWLWKLRPEMRPHGLNVDASGNWDDADGRLLPDHIGDGAALLAIMAYALKEEGSKQSATEFLHWTIKEGIKELEEEAR